jgi:hypothetical protein
MSNSDAVVGIFAMLGILYIVLFVLMIFGTITMIIAVTHSYKKRVVRGEDFSAGDVFLWYLGWGAACSYSLGIATIIYFFVKRDEIRATKQMCSQTLANVRNMNMHQAAQQQAYYQAQVASQVPTQQSYPPQQQQPPQQPPLQ